MKGYFFLERVDQCDDLLVIKRAVKDDFALLFWPCPQASRLCRRSYEEKSRSARRDKILDNEPLRHSGFDQA